MTHLRKITSQLKHTRFKTKKGRKAKKDLLKEIDKEESREK